MSFDEAALRIEARRRVADGRLPRTAPLYMWAGTGSGARCALCDRSIDAGQVEYELEFNSAPASVYRFHRLCHDAWHLEHHNSVAHRP
ncbi:MAG: hypothetical protein JOZ12_04520 [Sinobacteraceae bacterium]|nr:hypothetical protein [Nevskiaceae bacterium]MBV8852378.1 hypothetical protein [Nevskiaceae bacterium]MBV9911914.1 hypothetical protein [Nevskiaceae bacterium]